MSRHCHILNASLLHLQFYQLSYRASILTNRNHPSRPLNLSMIASILSTFFGSCILSIARTFSLASFELAFYIFSVSTSQRCVGFTKPLAFPTAPGVLLWSIWALRALRFAAEEAVLALRSCDLRTASSDSFSSIYLVNLSISRLALLLTLELLRFGLSCLEVCHGLFMHLLLLLPTVIWALLFFNTENVLASSTDLARLSELDLRQSWIRPWSLLRELSCSSDCFLALAKFFNSLLRCFTGLFDP